VLAFDAPNQLISEFPMALVPVFGVPLGVILHVASLIKLGRDGASGAQRRLTVRPQNSGRGIPRSEFF
jgi:hypothetical protein